MPTKRSDVNLQQQIVLCAEGRLELRCPARWPRQERDFGEVMFRLDPEEWALLVVAVETYEIPDDIVTGDLTRHLCEPEMAPESDFRTEGINDRIFRFDIVTETGNPQRIWRRQAVIGDYLRIATFTLQLRRDRAGTREHVQILDEAQRVVEGVRFPPEIVPVDRIGPSSTLKLSGAGDVIRMRVPVHWKRDREDGRTVFETDDPNGPTLWLDWDLFKKTDAKEFPEDFAVDLRDAVKDPSGDGLITRQNTTKDKDGTEIRIYSWHRVARRLNGLILAHFNLVFLGSNADTPEMTEIRTLVEREVINAVISYPGSSDPSQLI